jgi:hypothetical protein
MLEHCGPVSAKGVPVAVSGWPPGGGSAAQVPDDIAFVVHGRTARLSAAALLLVNLIDHTGSDPDGERARRLGPLLRGLVNFILLLQLPDGRFQPYFVVEDHDHFGKTDDQVAGMALLALSRAHGLVDDARIDGALKAGFAALERQVVSLGSSDSPAPSSCSMLRQMAPWLAFAALAEHSARPSEAVRKAGIGVASSLVGRCLRAGPGASEADLLGGYLASERVPGAQDVFAAAAAAAAMELAPEDPRLQEAAELGLALARRLVVTPGVNDHFLPAPGKAEGGVGRNLVDHRQRPDHAFAVVALLAMLTD